LPQVLQEDSEALGVIMEDASSKHISSLVWSLGMMGCGPWGFGPAATRSEVVEYVLGEGDYKAISAYVWGLAAMGVKSEAVVEGMGRKDVIEEVEKGGEEILEITDWALEKIRGEGGMERTKIRKLRDGEKSVRVLRG
jgi:hypothetical protein